MVARMTSWLSRPGLLRTVLSQMRLAIRLVRDPGVPSLTKALPVLAALYVLSPADLVPDVLPLLGQVDDLGVMLIALECFLRLCPAGPVAFHRTAIAQGRGYGPMSPADDFIDVKGRRE
jgi:uncharacterized membrane protein YkvA (DUF1232 family)